MDYEDYHRLVQTPVGERYDVSKLFHDHDHFSEFVADLAAPFVGQRIDLVTGIVALGFVPGTGVAIELGAGFVPIRKGEKLPVEESRLVRESLVDYSGASKLLEVDSTAIPDGSRVLIVDDWIETAAQMRASIALVERAGGGVAGISVLGMDDGAPDLDGYRLHTIKPR